MTVSIIHIPSINSSPNLSNINSNNSNNTVDSVNTNNSSNVNGNVEIGGNIEEKSENELEVLSLTIRPTYLNIYGYNFKGPELFNDNSKQQTLTDDILESLKLNQNVHGDCKRLGYVERNSLGNIEGFGFMKKFPLKFNHQYLEELYALNINHWILGRLIFISLLNLVITLFFWPINSISFGNIGFRYGLMRSDGLIGVLFHVLMCLTLLLIFIPISSLHYKFHQFAETSLYYSLVLISLIWGCWYFVVSYLCRVKYFKSSVSQLIVSTESFKTVFFVYCILPIITLDAFLPIRFLRYVINLVMWLFGYMWTLLRNGVSNLSNMFRTSRTLWIHIQFIIFYSVNTITNSYNTHISFTYPLFRIVFYVLILVLLYFGGFSTEIQLRISFYNWIITSIKIEKIQHSVKHSHQVVTPPDSAPVELILRNLTISKKLIKIIHNMIGNNMPETCSYFNQTLVTLENSITQLTKSNLFNIKYNKVFEEMGTGSELLNSLYTSYFTPINHSNCTHSFTHLHIQLLDGVDREYKYVSIPLSGVSGVSSDAPLITLDQLLNDWNFSILDYFRQNPTGFISIGCVLLSEFQTHFNIPTDVIYSFLGLVEKCYNNVSYHNQMHGVFVCQKLLCLSNFTNVYSRLSVIDRTILIISGLCHDIGHPGLTNAFFINSGHQLAHLFNDKSVLENFHCCLTFNVLRQSNLFSFLDKEEMKIVRRKIIQLILSTDLEDHFQTITQFRVRRASREFSVEGEIDTICKMLIKASDIGSSCMEWRLTLEWSQRLVQEFYTQGLEELSLGLPITPLCDPNKHNHLPKAQSGFLAIFVIPLYTEIANIPQHNTSSQPFTHIFT
eukprot:XP_766721.1 hypothetical protein [Theileria parva strain Muguga]